MYLADNNAVHTLCSFFRRRDALLAFDNAREMLQNAAVLTNFNKKKKKLQNLGPRVPTHSAKNKAIGHAIQTFFM